MCYGLCSLQPHVFMFWHNKVVDEECQRRRKNTCSTIIDFCRWFFIFEFHSQLTTHKLQWNLFFLNVKPYDPLAFYSVRLKIAGKKITKFCTRTPYDIRIQRMGFSRSTSLFGCLWSKKGEYNRCHVGMTYTGRKLFIHLWKFVWKHVNHTPSANFLFDSGWSFASPSLPLVVADRYYTRFTSRLRVSNIPLCYFRWNCWWKSHSKLVERKFYHIAFAE